MQLIYVKRQLIAALLGLTLVYTSMSTLHAAGSIAPQPTGYDFDTIFSAKNEPEGLHYQVIFAGAGGPHTLEVWRDGQARLRRKTDGALDTYVVRNMADLNEYQMTVVDYERHITTLIDRNNLIRLGHFTEWFDLSHGLRHPIGTYRLTASSAPENAPKPVSACKWYALTQDNQAPHHICWSQQDHLPLIIWSDHAGTVWRVSKITSGPIAANIFAMNDEGFVHNNANADINDD